MSWESCFCSPVSLMLGLGTGLFQSDYYKASVILMTSTLFSCHFHKQLLVSRHWSTFQDILGPRECEKMYKLPRRHGGGCSSMQYKSHFCPFRIMKKNCINWMIKQALINKFYKQYKTTRDNGRSTKFNEEFCQKAPLSLGSFLSLRSLRLKFSKSTITSKNLMK